MLPVATPAEMAAADRHAIDAGTSEATLIERAGRAVAWHARRLLGGAYGRRVLVVCGVGNNGADGRVAARVLAGWGMGVDVLDLPSRADGVIDPDHLEGLIARCDLAVDAMYGTGFRGELVGDAALVALALRAAPLVLAVDIPSGVDGTTGAVGGTAESVAVEADATITFAAHKPGLLFEPGRTCAGSVTVADIGLDAGPVAAGLVTRHDVERVLAASARRPTDHKWSSAVLVVGGSAGMTGAPMLAARAAQRCGAGMVVAALPGSAAERASGHEVVTRALAATPLGAIDAGAADDVLAELHRYRALVLGPGIGVAAPTARVVRTLVATAPRPVVVDADALRILGTDHSELAVRRAGGLAPAVLTPHAGEFEALTGRPLGDDRIVAARDLAAATGAVVVLKGPGTVIAAPDGAVAIAPNGGAELATPGTGDVLAGAIGALCARIVAAPSAAVPTTRDVFAATSAAVWLHGDAAARAGFGASTIASDLVAALPATIMAVVTEFDP